MDNENNLKPKSRWRKVIIAVIILFLLAGIGLVATIWRVYDQHLQPLSNSAKSHLVTIPVGSTPQEIALILEESGIIRKAWAFEWYVRNKGLRGDLKAGTYSLKPSQPVSEIATILTHGKVATDLVTIFPARRLDEVRDDLINQGFEAAAVDDALNPAHYADHPALVDKPQNASLEGYLYPESFEKNAQTTARDIVKLSLDEMHKHLTPDLRAKFVRQSLTVHQGVILASIIEQEIGSADPAQDVGDKKKVAQVFLRRIRENIALESDATAPYGAVLAGEEPIPGYESPYNTYKNPGLTPTPISNVGQNSLNAVAEPANTNYLYFVTGNDCVNRFSATLPEHEAFQRQHGVGCK